MAEQKVNGDIRIREIGEKPLYGIRIFEQPAFFEQHDGRGGKLFGYRGQFKHGVFGEFGFPFEVRITNGLMDEYPTMSADKHHPIEFFLEGEIFESRIDILGFGGEVNAVVIGIYGGSGPFIDRLGESFHAIKTK